MLDKHYAETRITELATNVIAKNDIESPQKRTIEKLGRRTKNIRKTVSLGDNGDPIRTRT